MKGRVEIDRERCKGCNFCVITCPKEIIVVDSEFNKSGCYPVKVIDPDKCTGCALCAEICPEVAILVWREEGKRTVLRGQK